METLPRTVRSHQHQNFTFKLCTRRIHSALSYWVWESWIKRSFVVVTSLNQEKRVMFIASTMARVCLNLITWEPELLVVAACNFPANPPSFVSSLISSHLILWSSVKCWFRANKPTITSPLYHQQYQIIINDMGNFLSSLKKEVYIFVPFYPSSKLRITLKRIFIFLFMIN